MIFLRSRWYFSYGNDNAIIDQFPLYCTIDNYFVPIFAGITGKLLKSGTHKAIVYNIQIGNYNYGQHSSSMVRFVKMFHEGTKCCIFEDYETSQVYHTMKHFIYTVENEVITPLYALCSTRQDIFTINQDNIDFSKFYLLINNKIFEPRHKKLAVKIKALIKYFTGLNVNIIYTNDISKLCLNTNYEAQSFTTLDERMLYIDKLKSQLGLYGRPKPQPAPIPTPEPTRYAGFIDALNDTWA